MSDLWYNGSHCYDPTAALAIMNVEGEEDDEDWDNENPWND